MEEDRTSLPPERLITFLKCMKVSIPDFYNFLETCIREIYNDAIEVLRIGLELKRDVEEPELEYLKIIFVLNLPIDKIFEYQARFYNSSLERVVAASFQPSGIHEGTRLFWFKKHFNFCFNYTLS